MTHDTPTPTLDLGPQARVLAHLAEGVSDARLADPTPCPDLAVRNLLGHLAGLAVAFRDAARKDLGVTTDTSPEASVPDIGPGWRQELPKVLGELAEAWRDPGAWTGMTRAGGIDLPGEVAGAVVADELVIHGWTWPAPPVRSTTPTRPPSRRRTGCSPPPRRKPTGTRACSAPSSPRPPMPRCWTGRSDSAVATRAGRGPRNGPVRRARRPPRPAFEPRQPQLPLSEALTWPRAPLTFNASYSVRHI